MYRKYVYRGVTWYDCRDPQEDEVVEVASLYGLEQGVVKLISNITVKHGVSRFKNCIVVSLLLPCTNITAEQKRIDKKPVHCVLGEDFILTVRFDDIRGFLDLKKELESPSVKTLETVAIFSRLLAKIYEHLHHDLSERLPSISQTHHEYAYKKYLIDYSRLVKKHEQTLETFCAVATDFFTKQISLDSLQEIIDHYREIERNLDQQHYVHVDCLSSKNTAHKRSYWRLLISKLVVRN